MWTRDFCRACWALPFFAASLDPAWAPDNGAPAGGAAAAPPPAAPPAGGDPPTAGTADDDDDSAVPPAAPPPQKRTQFTEKEFKGALRKRDKFHGALRAVLNRIGVAEDDISIRKTDDPDNPYEVVGLETVLPAPGEQGKPPKNDRGIALQKNRADRLDKEKNSLIKWIRENVVAANIRAACAKHGAVNDDDGQYEDIVGMLLPMFQCHVEFEDDAPTVDVFPVDKSGERLAKANGELHNEDSLVLDLLNRKPKFRVTQYVAGTGAGGNVVAGAPLRRNGTPGGAVKSNTAVAEEKSRQAVGGFFGSAPPPRSAM